MSVTSSKPDGIPAKLRAIPLSDAELEACHEKTKKVAGLDAKYKRSQERGTELVVMNPWTGEPQSYNEFKHYVQLKDAGELIEDYSSKHNVSILGGVATDGASKAA